MLSKNSQGFWSDGSGYIAAVMLRKSGSSGDGRHFFAFVVNPYDAARVIEWSDGEAVNIEPGAFAHLVSIGAARAVTDADLASGEADETGTDQADEIPVDETEKPRRGRPPKHMNR